MGGKISKEVMGEIVGMQLLSKEDAVNEIKDLIKNVDTIIRESKVSAEFTRWSTNTITFLEKIFGQNSIYFQRFISINWNARGSFVGSLYTIEDDIRRRNYEAFIHGLETAKGILLAAKDELIKYGLEEVYKGKNTPPESSSIIKIINSIDHKLRKIIKKPPAEEKEVQDALENLFIAADIPYSRETDSIEYSSKTYIPDFTIKHLDMAIEVKLCARTGREKEMIGEINDDILAYKTKYGNSLFVVYAIKIKQPDYIKVAI